MQISDITNMNITKNNTYTSMIPLILILRLFGLNCNIEAANLKSGSILVRSFLMTVLLGCLNFFGLYYKIKYVYPTMDLSIKLTDSIQIVYDFCQYIVDLYFVYKYGRHICVEYFKQYEYIDDILNVTCFSVMRVKLLKLMAFFFVIWTISSSIELSAWVLAYGWLTPICHSITYIFLYIKMLTSLDLIAHITHIGVRLRIVGDLMQNCYLSTDSAPNGCKADCVGNKQWLCTNYKIKPHVFKSNECTKEVEILTSCYLLLTEQVSFINRIYGFRILLNTLSLLSDMVKITNLSVRMVLGSQRTIYGTGYFPAMSSLLRLLTCAAIFVTLVNECENVYRERDRIVNIMDHLLVNKKPDDDLRAQVVNFRELIQDRPIIFNMANFFTLTYSLLVSLASVVVTYTIILLQSVN